jgi:hypothetical protein
MKKLYTVLLVLLPLLTSAQVDSLPFKTAKVIFLKTNLPDDELYKAVNTYLLSDGHELDKANQKARTLQTARKSIQNGRCIYVINASVKDGQVRFSGGFTSSGYEKTISHLKYIPIEKRDGPGSPFKLAFDSLNEVAIHLKRSLNGSLLYANE